MLFHWSLIDSDSIHVSFTDKEMIIFIYFRSLISYFTEISCRDLPFTDLKLENCELTCNQMIELLGVLSTMNKQLNMLSIKDNWLGR